MAITEGSYRELNARVPVSAAGPLPPRPVGAVAGPGTPPPPAQHAAARPLPCARAERAPLSLRGPLPFRLPEAHSPPRAAGWGFPPGSFSRWKGFS